MTAMLAPVLTLRSSGRSSGRTLLQQAIAAIKRNNGTLFYVPQNALGDGAPNLLSAPEFAGGLTDAPVRAGLVTLSSMSGYDNAINFGHDGSTLSYALKTPSHTNGLSYTLTVIVEMTDGLEPTFASTSMNSALNTFALVLFNITNNPLTYIVKSLGGAVYSVSATTVSSGSVQQAGVYKYATNNNRTFKVTGYKLELGSTATAYTPQSVLRTRGVFIDSAGVSPVTNIADVIGRMTDRTGGSAVATQATTANKPTVRMVPKLFGPNLVSNGNITGLPAGGGTRFYNMTGAMTPLVAGKTYLMTYTVSGYSGTGNVGIAGSAPAGIVQMNNTANGSYRVVQTPTAGGVIVFYTTNTNTANFSAIDVREVIEWSYAMSFDGSNDFLQTGITTGNEGWVCAGVTFGAADNADETVFSSGASISTAKGVWLLRSGPVSTNAWSVIVGNGTGRQLSRQSAVALKTGPVVVEGGWTASSITSAVNGIDGTPSYRTGDATPPPHAAFIGAGTGPAAFFNGPMTAQVICPVLPSAADRAIIRKWIGSLQGQSL